MRKNRDGYRKRCSMDPGDNRSLDRGGVTSLRVAALVLGLVLAMMVIIVVLPSPSTAQVSAKGKDPKAPPGYDPKAAKSIEVPLQFRTENEGVEGGVSAQSISDTNCTARLDLPHASTHTGWTKIGAYIGPRGCTYQKKRIWANVSIDIWDWRFQVWHTYAVRDTNSYNTHRNVKYASRFCPSGYRYYRSSINTTTIVDYDGTRHEMIFRRHGRVNRDACNGV